MSKDIRDLYKKRGQKLSKDINESKQSVEERLKANLANVTDMSAEMKVKLLQLQHKHRLGVLNTTTPLAIRAQDKDKLFSLIISFGINYQRVEGKKISNIGKFFDDLIHTHQVEISEEIFFDFLNELQNLGLLHFYNGTELLFEPLTRSIDLNAILRLVTNTGELDYKTIKKANPKWSDKKINDLVDLLELEGILIKDSDKFWFPQLQN